MRGMNYFFVTKCELGVGAVSEFRDFLGAVCLLAYRGVVRFCVSKFTKSEQGFDGYVFGGRSTATAMTKSKSKSRARSTAADRSVRSTRAVVEMRCWAGAASGGYGVLRGESPASRATPLPQDDKSWSMATSTAADRSVRSTQSSWKS